MPDPKVEVHNGRKYVRSRYRGACKKPWNTHAFGFYNVVIDGEHQQQCTQRCGTIRIMTERGGYQFLHFAPGYCPHDHRHIIDDREICDRCGKEVTV